MNASAKKLEARLLDVLTNQTISEEARRQCEEALDELRRRSRRNVVGAILSFLIAACVLATTYGFALMDREFGGMTALITGIFIYVAWTSIRAGIRDLSINPRDKLLITLAEDYLKRINEPNQTGRGNGGQPFRFVSHYET